MQPPLRLRAQHPEQATQTWPGVRFHRFAFTPTFPSPPNLPPSRMGGCHKCRDIQRQKAPEIEEGLGGRERLGQRSSKGRAAARAAAPTHLRHRTALVPSRPRVVLHRLRASCGFSVSDGDCRRHTHACDSLNAPRQLPSADAQVRAKTTWKSGARCRAGTREAERSWCARSALSLDRIGCNTRTSRPKRSGLSRRAHGSAT